MRSHPQQPYSRGQDGTNAPLKEAEIHNLSTSSSPLQIQHPRRGGPKRASPLPPAPGAGNTTGISSQGSSAGSALGTGTGHHAPFETRFRGKRALTRLIKTTRLVDCYHCRRKKPLAAAHIHPAPTGKGRAGEPCPCPGRRRHRSGALPRGLCHPERGAGEDDRHLCKGGRRDGGLVPGTCQERARAEPRDRHR